MNIFLDTADVESIRKHYETGIIDGVTTNPSLILKSHKNPDDVYQELADIGIEDISMEVVDSTVDGMLKEAERLVFAWKNEIFTNSIDSEDNHEHAEEDHHHGHQINTKVDEKRRKALLITSGIMGAVTVTGFAVPFLSAWKPSEKAKALGASVKFDLSKLQPGAMAIVEWRRTPIFVVHQTQEAIDNLPKLNDKVTDQANELLPSSNNKFTVLKFAI